MSGVVCYFLLLIVMFKIGDFTEADDDPIPVYVDNNCTITRNFSSNSPYQITLNTLLFALPSQASNNNKSFYNTSNSVETTSDTIIYVSFLCRGDIPTQLCHDCVADASKRLMSECPNNKEAIIWYEECFVRYSDHYFFSTLSEGSRFDGVFEYNNQASNMTMKVIEKTLNDVLEEAATATVKFATKEANLNSNETLYSLAECTPDLSDQDCRKCLRDIISWFRQVNRLGNFGEFFFPSCNLRCGPNQFYYKSNTVPQQTYVDYLSHSIEFYYLNHSCSTTKTFTINSGYDLNLKKLISSMIQSSNDTNNMGFNSTKVVSRNPSDTVYGLFMCRGDLSPQVCHQCVNDASQQLSNITECVFSKEAIILYDMCLFRYSNHSFFSTVDTSPKHIVSDVDIAENKRDSFNLLLEATLDKVIEDATKSGHAVIGAKKFATEDADNQYQYQKLYTLAQCTPDLSNQGCDNCLRKVVEDLKFCCFGKTVGLVMYPSCTLRFQTTLFYNKSSTTTSVVESPMLPSNHSVSSFANKGKAKAPSQLTIVTLVVVPLVVSIVLFCFAYYLLQRKNRRNKAILKENFGSDSATLESLQFNLATIEAATNKFSHENKIGKGGFGEVYKGVLLDGREIAVKRLSKSSGQGATEFKNEILLIAKLQHRNLVALIGFCLEEQEKMLIYEFVPNKSLDYFLFGSQRKRILSWSERSKIIEGIAHGILYLHEHSRLKIIHRDLKPSNILLDDEMNPKISDFGMARMVSTSESEGTTNRIVGTYGYMSPEYAMFGQFSEKSDVFSFGVMVLEIVSGKKNTTCHESQYIDGLLRYIWNQWREEKWSEILDSNMIELESHGEVIKCIHIGLLCIQENQNARPSMVSVVQYLSNDSIQLPFPQEPIFFSHERMEQSNIRGMRSSFGQHANDSIPCSINEMTLSKFFPR